MFIIILTYIKPLETINFYLSMHREFLDEGYKNNFFVASGPQNPRTGGIIISQLKSLEQLKALLKLDPFSIHNVAEYEIINFIPTKYHTNFAFFV